MKIHEMKHSVQCVISTGAYENQREFFELGATMEDGDDPETAMATLERFNHDRMKLAVDKAKTDRIEKEYDNIRFYEKDGKKYPSVTSILNWDKDFRVSADELNQYASRGTIVHELIEHFLIEDVWRNPNEMPELMEDVAIVLGGSLGLHWDQCTHEAFFKANGKDIDIGLMEQEVINTQVGYGGRLDAIGTYKGKPAIFDWKTGSIHDFRQLSAYAICCDIPIENLIICPVGRTDNKSGVMKPKVSEDIEGEFEAFLKARKSFRRRFGI